MTDSKEIMRTYQGGDLDAALELAQQALSAQPNRQDLLQVAAFLELARGQIQAALGYLSKSGSIANKIEILDHLSEQFRIVRAFGGAQACMQAILAIKPDDVAAKIRNIGFVLLANDPEKALSLAQQTLEQHPDNTDALYMVGNTLRVIGRIEESAEIFDQAFQRDVNSPAVINYSASRKFAADDPSIETLSNAFENNRDEESRIFQAFAIAKMIEDGGDYDRAFEWYQRGNDLKRETLIYDLRTDIAAVERSITAFDENTRTTASNHGDGPRPIFVVSLPRSGSTLLEQMLAGHSMIQSGGETTQFQAAMMEFSYRTSARDPHSYVRELRSEAQAVAAQYLESTFRIHAGTHAFTDKTPNNIFNLGAIKMVLPQAKIIHIQRGARDTCLGCYRQLFMDRGEPYSYRLDELGQYHRLYRRLADHWKSLFGNEICDVQYEDLVTDPEQEIRRILAYCELPFEEECLAFTERRSSVLTLSAVQVREPLNRGGIERWRRYEKHLGPLFQALED